MNRRGHEAGNYGFDTQSSGSKPWCLDVFSVFCRELQSLTKTVYFLVDPGVTFCPRGWGKCGSKMGPVAPARPCCLAVWWPFVWGLDLVVLVSGCQDVTSRTVTEIGFCEAARPCLFSLSLQNHGFECVL